MKSLTIRFYDQTNLGDDLFVKIVADRYANPIIATRGTAMLRYSDYYTPYIPKVLYYPLKVVERLLGLRHLPLRMACAKSDVMLYIGGSLFMEPADLTNWYKEAKLYASLNKPYYILGSNVGPVHTDEFVTILQGIFAGATDVCFRDQASYEMFRDIPVARVATDIAFTLDTSTLVCDTPARRVIISVIDIRRKITSDLVNGYEQTIIKLTQRLIANGYTVTLMSFCKYEGDETAIQRIIQSMDDATRAHIETHMYTGDLDTSLAVLADCEMIIGSRFHASILGLLLGKKVLPMAYSDKTINILADMGFVGPIVDIRKIDEFDSANFDFDSLQINDISQQIELAEQQFRELDKVLTRRDKTGE